MRCRRVLDSYAESSDLSYEAPVRTWRSIGNAKPHGGPGNKYAGDIASLPSSPTPAQPCGASDYAATGVGGGKWYRFSGAGGDALPLKPPGGLHCGTGGAGWLSAFPSSNAGSPPTTYTTPGVYPASGIATGTVCFDHGTSAVDAYPCKESVKSVKIASKSLSVRHACAITRLRMCTGCDGFYLWQLPFTPSCADAYCTRTSAEV